MASGNVRGAFENGGSLDTFVVIKRWLNDECGLILPAWVVSFSFLRNSDYNTEGRNRKWWLGWFYEIYFFVLFNIITLYFLKLLKIFVIFNCKSSSTILCLFSYYTSFFSVFYMILDRKYLSLLIINFFYSENCIKTSVFVFKSWLSFFFSFNRKCRILLILYLL